jgi:hypothetical protein
MVVEAVAELGLTELRMEMCSALLIHQSHSCSVTKCLQCQPALQTLEREVLRQLSLDNSSLCHADVTYNLPI